MAIRIKSKEQIERMRVSNQIVARTHQLLESYIKPGITTKELEEIADDYIRGQGAYPSFLGYGYKDNPYPASICISINEEVIHGIPGIRKLNEGDIVSIDIGALINGFHGDAARTHAVGKVSAGAKKLIDVARDCFFNAIQNAKAGRHLNEIGATVESTANAAGFTVVRDYVGHGIGSNLHEDPQVANHRMPSRGPRLYAGMTLAIEPMVNAGVHEVELLKDGWTVVTKDRKLSAHYENTILVTDGQPEILSL
jgi:methionyl aminopeptidase